MGINEEKVRNLHDYKGSELFGPVEQLVLEYMEQIALERRTDPEIEARLKQHFNNEERVELTEEKIKHMGDDEPPEGVYAPAEQAIISYARKSTLEVAIDDETYGALQEHYTRNQIMEIWALAATANAINRFHATFHTDVDEEILEAVEAGDQAAGGAVLNMPPRPGRGKD